jgi:nitroreductase
VDSLFFGAPAIIYLTTVKSRFDTQIFDLGLAAENILISAKLLGLDTIPVVSPRYIVPDLIKQELKIPDDEEFFGAIAVGYEDPYEISDYSSFYPGFGTRKTDNAKFIE